ncbi:STAS domain-containing protein [Actinoplanes nipponensis]|nr:STAS domain-containing protein [Actinoplanes nipponensis]
MDPTDAVPLPEVRFGPPVRDAGGLHISVGGDIDMTTGDLFTRTLHDVLVETDVAAVTLDIGQLHFIDSNGVTALIRSQWAARERGIRLTISNACGPVREILEMLDVYETLSGGTPPAPHER